MGSLRRGNDHQRPTCSATTPHFLQIIPAGSSGYRKLRIPNKFVRAYGDHLSNPIHLKLPSGDEWEVDMTECDGEVWFDKGWQKFSEFYTLDYGDLVVFRYEGNSKFHVCIFDRSATEIDYPITPPSSEETDDESLQILEDFPSYLKSRDKSPRPHVKKRVSPSSSSETESRSSDSQNVILERTHPLTKFEKEKALQRAIGFKSENPHFKIAMQPTHISEKLALPIEFGLRYLTNQPASTAILRVQEGGTWCVKLIRYIKHSQVCFRQGWLAFVRDNNLKVGDVCVFTLTTDIQLVFEVVFFRSTKAENYPLYPEEEPLATSKGEHSGNMSLKEIDYEDDDCIEVSGDLQSFRRRRRENSPLPSPQPHKKFRLSSSSKAAECKTRDKDSHCSKSQVKWEKSPFAPSNIKVGAGRTHISASCAKAIALHRANAFKTANPSCRVVLQPSDATQSCLPLPMEFVKGHLTAEYAGNVTLRGPNGGTWSVKFECEKSRAIFKNGWLAFVRDNKLEMDDVCVFILNKRIELSFEVAFFRWQELNRED